MDYGAHVEAVERETARFVDILSSTDLEARVPTCPEWSLRDLTVHTGGFVGFWTHVLCEGARIAKTPAPEPPPAPGSLTDWFSDLRGHLLDRLHATEPTAAMWTWAPQDQSARFIARRCANELAVHRFDAEAAAGQVTPIDPVLAADGIDEIFFMIDNWHESARDRRGMAGGNGETLHLHADEGGEWTITLDGDGVHVARTHADSDLTLTGTASDLELTLYRRPPIGTVERAGDASALDAWYRAFHFG